MVINTSSNSSDNFDPQIQKFVKQNKFIDLQ